MSQIKMLELTGGITGVIICLMVLSLLLRSLYKGLKKFFGSLESKLTKKV